MRHEKKKGIVSNMIHGRGSCTGGPTGKSLVKQGDVIKRGKNYRRKEEAASGGGKKSRCLKRNKWNEGFS